MRDEGRFSLDEWLITNESGSFAMGSPDRVPRRRYHGMLVADTAYFPERQHLLADVTEVLHLDDQVYELGNFQYKDVVHPHGYRHLTGFSHEPIPCWTYDCDGVILHRRLVLHPEINAVRLEYTFENAPEDARVVLYPMFTGRSAHDLQRENAILDGRAIVENDRVTFKFYKRLPELYIRVSPDTPFQMRGFWNNKVTYLEEFYRGYADHEDLFCPGHFVLERFNKNGTFSLEVGISEEVDGPLNFPRKKAVDRSPLETLAEAASSFIVQPYEEESNIQAGYPWLGCYGRETFVALPGLTLARDRADLATEVLDTWSDRLKNGLIPDVLAYEATDDEVYSVDPSLWFIRAVQQVEQHAGVEAVSDWEPVVLDILDTIRRQKLKSIHIRPSGLLYASSSPRPLTWMNAVVDGRPVTPRSPFAVEVNALFYNAIRYAMTLAERRDDRDFVTRWKPVASALKKTFIDAFWLKDAGYLADAHSGSRQDTSLRPNQLIAMMGPYHLVSREQGASILKHVRGSLLTPLGLRSLAPEDPAYHGSCFGHQDARNEARHQGSIWPWFLGPYVDAVLYVEGEAPARAEATRIRDEVALHLKTAGLGTISQMLDGNSPHIPRGAPSFAPSVAELYRILHLIDG